MADKDPTVNLDELEMAFAFSDGLGEPTPVYVSRLTGELVYDAEDFTGEPCPVEDIDCHPDYVHLPDAFDLDLKQALVWRFVRAHLPEQEPEIREFFRRRGAYGRYKSLLESEGKLEDWFEFENRSTREALVDWCRHNGISVHYEPPPQALTPVQREQLNAISAVIQRRRSIKPAEMSDQPIDRALLDQLLENANWAPTHGGTEPWRFHIFTGEGRKRLAQSLQDIYQRTTPEESFRPDKFEKFGRNPLIAPVVIVLTMQRQASEKIPEIEEVEATACAVQNLHLSAAAVGLGGFWSSHPVVYTREMHDWLKLGPKDQCLGMFYLGWPKEGSNWPEGRRKPIEEKLRWIES